MNSLLNKDIPVGHRNLNPKRFNNSPYHPNHRELALRGTTPLPASHVILDEHPLTPNGWTGHTQVGRARVITSTIFILGYDCDHFHGVLYHDAGRGGLWDDHYSGLQSPSFTFAAISSTSTVFFGFFE